MRNFQLVSSNMASPYDPVQFCESGRRREQIFIHKYILCHLKRILAMFFLNVCFRKGTAKQFSKKNK